MIVDKEDLEWYVSSLPPDAHPYLEMQLDWDNDFDRDLIEIANFMISWEDNLATHLELTAVDIHDIKNERNIKLQR